MHLYWTFVFLYFLPSFTHSLFRLEHVAAERCEAFFSRNLQLTLRLRGNVSSRQGGGHSGVCVWLGSWFQSDVPTGLFVRGCQLETLLLVYFHSFRHPLSVDASASAKSLPASGSVFLLSALVWRDPCWVSGYTSVKFKCETSVAEYEGESLKDRFIDKKIK